LVCSLYFFFTSVFRGNWVQLTCLNETGPDRHESSWFVTVFFVPVYIYSFRL
jgi:hypothetical protein